jgi:hypothetical protein
MTMYTNFQPQPQLHVGGNNIWMLWMSVLHIETLHASTSSCETLGQRRLSQSGKQSYVSETKISPEQQTTQL